MPEGSDQERTEEPTTKRREEARQKGSVAKSSEINSALITMSGLIILMILGPWMVKQLRGVMVGSFDMIADPRMTRGSVVTYMTHCAAMVGRTVLPVALVLMIIGIVSNYIQIGWLVTVKPLMPRLDKISPMSGFKRMFSLRSIVELVKNIAKLAIIGTTGYLVIKGEFARFLTLSDTSARIIVLFLLHVAFKLVFRIALVMIIIAILDYLYQKYEYEKGLKMTKQEVKEELKQMEGDPQIKSRIKSLQREMARRRMMGEVPKATVVVTNPTYIAIAIQYEPERMSTPRVVAKGKRLIAEKIKELARSAGVPVVEDKPLARAMYDRVEVGEDIPVDFFTAVAEVLAYVFRLRRRGAA